MAGERIRKTRKERISEGIDQRIRGVLNAQTPDPSSTQYGITGQAGTGGIGGGTTDPPLPVPLDSLLYSLTVPNNSTASLPVFNPAADFGYLYLTVGWKRGATRGVAYMDVHHNGTTGTLTHRIGTNPGWNTAGFVVAVSGDDLTITFAANNNVDAIEMYVTIEWQPLIP